MLSDKALSSRTGDRFEYAVFADALAYVIADPRTDTPYAIAISARWGAGKTSLARMLEERLTERPNVNWFVATLEGARFPVPRRSAATNHITCWFDAWLHQDAPHLGAALAADVARAVDRERPRWRRLVSPLPLAMLTPDKRWRRRAGVGVCAFVLALAAGLAIALLPGLEDFRRLDLPGLRRLSTRRSASFLGLSYTLSVVVLVVCRKLFASAQAAAAFVDEPRSEAARGAMEDVRRQIGGLIHEATRRWTGRTRRLVVFIDDLERCKPDGALEVCDVASQLLAHPDVITVFIADMSVVAESAEHKYAEQMKSTANSYRPGDFGRLYLQKIVQIEFDLPPVKVESLRAMVEETLPWLDQPGDVGVEHDDAQEQANEDVRPPEAPEDIQEQTSDVGRREARSDILDLLRVVGAVVAVLFLIGLVTAGISQAVQAAIASPYWFAAATFGILVLVALITWLRSQLADIRKQEERRLETAVQREASSVKDPEKLVERVLAEPPGPRQRLLLKLFPDEDDPKEAVVERLVTNYLIETERRRALLRSDLLNFLPLLPRSAKRTVNRLHLLITVAYERRMLGGEPELTADHVVKWVVLGERWPELARALGTDPSLITALETAASPEDLRNVVDRLASRATPVENLFEFLAKDPTPFGAEVLKRLVYFEPVEELARVALAPSHDTLHSSPPAWRF